jgi:hypothetical protein
VFRSQESLVLGECRIFVTAVVVELPLELALEILLLVPSSESGWSYFGSVVVAVLVYGMLEVAEVVFSSVEQYRLVALRVAVRLSFLPESQA